MSKSLLPYFHGCIEPIHQASVGVSERMQPAAPIALISSVSGGAVGTLFFTNQYAKSPGHAGFVASGRVLQDIVETSVKPSLNDVGWALAYADFWRVFFPYIKDEQDKLIDRGWADRYFFRQPRLMVAGAVASARLELGNKELVEAHLHSVWLGAGGCSLGRDTTNVLDLEKSGFPLQAEIQDRVELSESMLGEALSECKRIVDACGADIARAPWRRSRLLSYSF